MKFGVDLIRFKRNPKFGQNPDFGMRFWTIFRLFFTDNRNRPQIQRRSRICGSFWRDTNRHTTINEFRNQK